MSVKRFGNKRNFCVAVGFPVLFFPLLCYQNLSFALSCYAFGKCLHGLGKKKPTFRDATIDTSFRIVCSCFSINRTDLYKC